MTPKVDAAQLEHFWWFVEERHQIYRRRFEASYPPPWTNDPILLTRRFTNVYRDLDPGSGWIMDHVRRHPPATLRDVFWTFTVYRFLNRIETYERHGLPARDPDDIHRWFTGIRRDQDAGISVATGSHCSHVRDILPWLLAWTDDDIVLPVVKQAHASMNIEGVQRAVSKMKGAGTFLSLQIALDYAASPWSHLPPDSRVPLAQGSRSAIGILMSGRIDVRSTSQTKAGEDAVLTMLHDEQRTPTGGRFMTYVDVEHTLCEWGKYRKFEAGKKLSNFLPFKSGQVV